jgi:uncharacterized membrane protein YvlD (DUF360 family)
MEKKILKTLGIYIVIVNSGMYVVCVFILLFLIHDVDEENFGRIFGNNGFSSSLVNLMIMNILSVGIGSYLIKNFSSSEKD